MYPDAVRNEDDISRVVEALPDIPISINMGFGIRSRPTTPLLSFQRLAEIGVARITAPRMLTAAAIAGIRTALEIMRQGIDTGRIIDRPDLLAGMEEITTLMGYARVSELESAFLLEEQIETKYQSRDTNYVVH